MKIAFRLLRFSSVRGKAKIPGDAVKKNGDGSGHRRFTKNVRFRNGMSFKISTIGEMAIETTTKFIETLRCSEQFSAFSILEVAH